MTKIHISLGNRKLGAIPSVSFPPVTTCRKGVACVRKCYAMKAYRMYPSVRKALDENLALWLEDDHEFFNQLVAWLEKHQPSRFRFCVSGDAPTAKFFNMIIAIAWRFPQIKFLMYTKRTDFINSDLCDFSGYTLSDRLQDAPTNICIRISLWYGERLQGITAPSAGIVSKDGKDSSQFEFVPFDCVGSCVNCSACWNKSISEIRFTEH